MTRGRTSPFHKLGMLIGAMLMAELVDPVAAASIDPGTILPNAISSASIGLNFAMYGVSSNAIGTLVYTNPGCNGICQVTTSLGSDPAISAQVDEVTYELTGGGIVQGDLGYYVELAAAPGTYNVTLTAPESIDAPDGINALTHLKFGVAGENPSNFNNFASTALEEADCTGQQCTLGKYFYAPGVTPGPFVATHTVQMQANTPYFLQMDIIFEAGATGVQDSAFIDPTFTASSGSFLFSPGVTAVSPAPEPATWAMMIGGLGLIGATMRRRRTVFG